MKQRVVITGESVNKPDPVVVAKILRSRIRSEARPPRQDVAERLAEIERLRVPRTFSGPDLSTAEYLRQDRALRRALKRSLERTEPYAFFRWRCLGYAPFRLGPENIRPSDQARAFAFWRNMQKGVFVKSLLAARWQGAAWYRRLHAQCLKLPLPTC